MKFMKLGSKPDTFLGDGKSIRYVSSDLATDVIINVGEVKFYLHKFPLLSKSNHMKKLVLQADEENSDEIQLPDFPGGPKAFEICAKFCYGMTVTLNAHNIVAARCAAEYLEMTEDVDRGNLIFKIEAFLNSSIFRSWKDSIIVLQTTESLLPWSEDLKIVGKCVDSIASKICIDPSSVTWSYTHKRKLNQKDEIIEDDVKYQDNALTVPKDWWVEDLCELEIDLYKKVMTAVESKGRVDGRVIFEALKTYAIRWLPDSLDALVSEVHARRNKSLVETIICLLPTDQTAECSCSFLLKLLRIAILVEVDESLREYLITKIIPKLHQASVDDLLVPAQSHHHTKYDLEVVQDMVKKFFSHENCTSGLDGAFELEDKNCIVLGHGSLVSVSRLMDKYLAEVAKDPELSLSSFINLSQSVPDLARPVHDGLYKAIDIYLKNHQGLTKADRKQICSLMDVQKLSVEASMHAAQNERLPLRVVVQVLFLEQIRTTAKLQTQRRNSLNNHMNQMEIREEEIQDRKLTKKNRKNSVSGMQLLPSRSRRIFDRLWGVGRGNGDSKSSETSGSSRSPTSLVLRGTKSSESSSSRHRRHSVS